MAPPPSETSILDNYLIKLSRLPSIITLQEFTAFFPKSQQSSPQIRSLYRDLQQRRNAVVDKVAENIDVEVRKGPSLRRAIAKTRRDAQRVDEEDDEVEIERNLFGATSTTRRPKKLTLQTILPEMESAVTELEQAIEKLEEEETALLESVRQTVGSMSDLRYGRLSNPKLRDEVLEGLEEFQETCKDKIA